MKDKQEENFSFVGSMFRQNPSAIRDIPDDLVKSNTIIQKIADEKLGKGDTKSNYALKNANKINEVHRQLDYIEAVKNGTKEEFLEKEREDFKKSLGKSTTKSDKSAIEDAKTATQAEKTTVSEPKKEEVKNEEPKKNEVNEPKKEDEFPF